MITQHTKPNRPWMTALSIKKPGKVLLFDLDLKILVLIRHLLDNDTEIKENDKSVSNF